MDPFDTSPRGPNTAWAESIKFTGKKDIRRTFSKRFIYRLLYGARPDTCIDIPGVRHLGLDIRGLIQASENWLNAHPAIRRYQRLCAERATQYGMIYTFMGRRRTLIETGAEAARQAMNHPMQGGCMDIYEETIYEIDKEFFPTLRFRWGMHDSHKWDMPMDKFELDQSIGFPLLGRAANIVQQPRLINGHNTAFPATFHWISDIGVESLWIPPASTIPLL
jgi:hypothetical protein